VQGELFVRFEYKQLNEARKEDFIQLMNHPKLRKHMPLLRRHFGETEYKEFIDAKQTLWSDYGFGPWAIFGDGKFIGWGGLQPEHGDADLALVLHPDYWGMGKDISRQIIKRAFTEMRFDSIIILFPPTRTRVKGILRLGFYADGEVDLEGERFLRYRLDAPRKRRAFASGMAESLKSTFSPENCDAKII